MKPTNYMTVMTGGAVAATLLIAQMTPCAAQNNRTIFLDAGTVIPVKLRDTLSSADARKGDRFTATLKSDDAARSLDLPPGTDIEGTVESVRPMQGKDPGVISLRFDRVILPNESSVSIQGSLIGLDDKSVNHTQNGRLVAKPDQKNKTLMYAGYGAGAGLLLGALTKGNALLDTVIGGGLGYLFGNLDKNHGDPKDVTLKPGTEMGVRLDRSARITTYTDNSNSGPIPRNDRNADGTYKYGDRPNRNTDQGYRNGDGSGANTNRDQYNNETLGHQTVTGSDTYQVLNRFTDVRDSGQPIRVFVDGRELSFQSGARPFISNGVVMVPAAPVLRAAHVPYSYASGRFTADGPGEPLTVTIGSRVATGSSTHRFDLPATVRRRNGTLYVPMQFLAVVTGQNLSFDRDTQTMELGADRIRSDANPH